MKIVVRHRISIGLPAGTPRAVLHLLVRPQSGPIQTVEEWTVEMPGIAEAPEFTDAFGNRARLVTIARPDTELSLSIIGRVDTTDRNGVVGRPPGEPVPSLFRRATPLAKPVGAVTSRLRSMPRDGGDRIALLHTLMARIGEHFAGAAGGQQSQGQDADGQAQMQASTGHGGAAPVADVVHGFVGSARALGIPARYVGGYCAGDGDAAAAHAWAEAWDDGLGWIGFDPVLGVCPTERHVRVATGLDGGYVVPVRSVPAAVAPGHAELSVEAQ